MCKFQPAAVICSPRIRVNEADSCFKRSDSRLPAETIRDVRDYTDYPRPISNLPARAYKPLFERDSTRH